MSGIFTSRISTLWPVAATAGDGYYESVVLDPDGNRIEITV
ncbi:MAG TPA: hypothetical protein VIU34_09245 [Steroidobacter sp.]